MKSQQTGHTVKSHKKCLYSLCHHLVLRVVITHEQTPTGLVTDNAHFIYIAIWLWGRVLMATIFKRDNHNYEKMLQSINCVF